jgi:hypothetical protein
MSFGRMLCVACLAPVLAAAEDARAERDASRPVAAHRRGAAELIPPDGPPLAAYRARRILRAENDRFHASAELEAVTELRPDGTFAYEIVREAGSGHIRKKVLRKMLRDEAELRRRGDTDRGSLTPANYVFTEERSGGGAERRVLLSPRRKDILLVDGVMVLSRNGDLLRIEGRLARNPSFWTRRVQIVRRYSRLGGVRVPISTESVADIRFAGRSRFEMVYQYESVNGRPVSHRSVPARAAWLTPGARTAAGVPDILFEHATAR